MAILACACGDNLGAVGDGGALDARLPGDAAVPDAAVPDAAVPDAAVPDAAVPDAAVAPTVISTSPTAAAVAVSIAKRVHATFNSPMDPATITATSVTLRRGAVPITGVVTYDAPTRTATFTAASLLDPTVVYTATITTAATDAGGQALAADYVWTFTTGACGQAPVALGAVASYAVLAGSTVTSTGATMITGDLGVSPGTAVTGFPPGVLVGTREAGTAPAAQAMAALTTAYNEAAGRALCPTTIAGNLGGRTLAAGLYKSTSSIEVSSGDLTLDGGGDPDAVFVFQSASTLSATANRRVVLAGSAQASNVFWQVGTSAVLGTGSDFAGTILADQAITLDTGATLNGRALARIAAVSLDATTIVRP